MRAFFKYLHASWTPERFRHRAVVHGRWVKSASDRAHRDANPQYLLRLAAPAAAAAASESAAGGGAAGTLVWVLFQRHLRGDVPAPSSETAASKGADEGDVFTAVHVHRGGDKAYWPEAAAVTSVYSDSPHALLRIELGPAAGAEAVLVVSALGPPAPIGFTITAYSVVPCVLVAVPQDPPYVAAGTVQAAKGRWEGATAGGCPNHGDSFGRNPAFLLHLDPAAPAGGAEVRLWCKLAVDVEPGAAGDDLPAVGMHLFKGEAAGGAAGRAEAVLKMEEIKAPEKDKVRACGASACFCMGSVGVGEERGQGDDFQRPPLCTVRRERADSSAD